ncbi:bifunctional rhamnulose-1-phosphate aldolase/short-chain dehydrogenase [Fimbriimonas ginsengisoli]|uniref:Rhamnulose-1-phosphate aldolase/alcohol dehydrogenase n=1 Tax=Fimbriimonas ginsengisoli Gsoil 348 TaxID=661478 RepID=A0A068NXB9_FIMGI|nr:bifunctional rhamnulose-1-phosphate aldolase/short-chain dehydrogenase [Fimbriimonas ginsengisoli]AIE86279.1 rhamnulose-1-phosphate aldolase/alcohol dehydrogenase [Fimbriimonas ginsengisoli Gsoil 348]
MHLRYLKDLWNDDETRGMDEPELLRYRSNLLGSDLRLTNFGGGNTSAKVTMADPVTGEDVTVLWVKGSGGDLGTIKRDGFATLYLDRLLALKNRYKGVDEEDAMADMYPLCTFNNNPRAASIDTPLHGFLPYKHVDHLHPDWAIALAACANGPEQLKRLEEETGLKLAWLPWKRPGFELGLWLQKADAENPGLDGIILGSHGLFTWGNTSRESYLNTLRVIDGIGQYVMKRVDAKGEALFGGAVGDVREDRERLAVDLLPALRGRIGGVIGHYDARPEVLRFVNSAKLDALAWQGTSCPDHFVRTKVRPMVLRDTSVAGIEAAFAKYRNEYRAYYEENRLPDSPALRNPNPTVVLVPGVGLFSFGKNKTEARITGEFYVNAIHVMEGATALAGELPMQAGIQPELVVDNYVALPLREAFNIEYWSLEEAKLQRMPPEKEMSRKVAVLVGASPGIGHGVAELLLKNGAHLVVTDVNAELAEKTAEEMRAKYGREVVASQAVNITDRESVRRMLDGVVSEYGGLDVLVNIAAVFIAPGPDGKVADELWKRTYEINVVGSAIIAEEARAVVAKQGTKGSFVLVSSANAVVSKKGSVAYDTSKAAVNHLVRELAIEFSPDVRVNAIAPATVVEGSQMFPRDRTISSLQKYDIAFEESESTEDLRAKLANFYAQRTLLKQPVSPAKVAEAIYLLATDRFSLTTGHVVPVDAGLPEAFLR